VASLFGWYDTAALLLKARASVNEAQTDGGSWPALQAAACESHRDACLLLLDAKAPSTVGALCSVLPLGEVDTCRAFIEAKADVNASDSGGNTPLMVAIPSRCASVCSLLLAAHANPHAQDEYGRTALHHAACDGVRDVCLLLLQADAAPLLPLFDIKDNEGNTALQLATQREHATTAQFATQRERATTVQLLRDWRGCAAFDAQTRANWLSPPLPKGQTYSWAQPRLFDVHLIKEIASFLLCDEEDEEQ
jgi:ankyrin repeat protein